MKLINTKFTRDDIVITEHKANKVYNGNFGNVQVTLCSSISIVTNVDFFFDQGENMLYLDVNISDSDLHWLIIELVHHYEGWDAAADKYHYQEDWASIKRAIDGKVSVENLVNVVNHMVGKPDGGLSTITIDLNANEINVVDASGKSHLLNVSDS